MGRRKKQTVDYFPHDAYASSGDTIGVLEERYGSTGYAFWFKLLERLCLADGHYLDCRANTKWLTLLAKLGVNELYGTEIMGLLADLDAIDKELWQSRVIWCQHLVENLDRVYKNRRLPLPQRPIISTPNLHTTYAENGVEITTATRITTPEMPNSAVEIPQSKVEYIYPIIPKITTNRNTDETLARMVSLLEENGTPLTPLDYDRLKEISTEITVDEFQVALKKARDKGGNAVRLNFVDSFIRGNGHKPKEGSKAKGEWKHGGFYGD